MNIMVILDGTRSSAAGFSGAQLYYSILCLNTNVKLIFLLTFFPLYASVQRPKCRSIGLCPL